MLSTLPQQGRSSTNLNGPSTSSSSPSAHSQAYHGAQDRLVAAVLLEEMDRKKRALLAALDDDLVSGTAANNTTAAAAPSSMLAPPPTAVSGSQRDLQRSRRGSAATTANNTTSSASLLRLTAEGPEKGGPSGAPHHQQQQQQPLSAAYVNIDADELNQLARPLLSIFRERVTAPMREDYALIAAAERVHPWLVEPTPEHVTSKQQQQQPKGKGRESATSGSGALVVVAPSTDTANTIAFSSQSTTSTAPHPARTAALERLRRPDHYGDQYDSTATATRHAVQLRAADSAAAANALGPTSAYLFAGAAGSREAFEMAKRLNPHRHGGLSAFVSEPAAALVVDESALLAATRDRGEAAVRRRREAVLLQRIEDEEDVARRGIVLEAAEAARLGAQALDIEFEQENRWRRPYVPRQRC